MTVDSFRFLPRIIAAFYQTTERQPEFPIPWSPLSRPIHECKFSLVNSGGIYLKASQSPFDIEREKLEPTWGDPTFRTIPTNLQQGDIGVSHLHYNHADVLEDINILLPVQRFQELEIKAAIGSMANNVYSFMGYQGYPPDPGAWCEVYGLKVAKKLRAEGVNCILLTPA
jgi:D-proline reductase (dithiol) PrdB